MARSAILKSIQLPDLLAGLSIAGLLLPEAVAYAGIANVPPQMAVIGLLAGLLCYALLGSSRFAIVSATSSSAAVLAAATAAMANGDADLRLLLVFGLVIITGLFFILASLMRLGEISSFIAKPVLRGFTFGLAIVIILRQLPKVVGITPQHTALGHFTLELFSQVLHWNPYGVAIGVISLSLLFFGGRVRYLPAPLVVIALGIGVSAGLPLAQFGVALVGPIRLDIAMPGIPRLTAAEWLRLAELAAALVMILYAESYSSIRSFAMKHGDDISPDRDLAALGFANLLSGLFHGMPVGAGYSATSANEAAGAVSRWAGVVAAATILLVALMLLPLLALTPEPVLAAIVIYAVSHTLKPAIFRPYFLWQRDRVVVVTSVLAVLMFGVLDGLLASIAVSMLMMLRRFASGTISTLGRQREGGHDFVSLAFHEEARAIPGILILRPDEALIFANVERVLNQTRQLVLATGDSMHTLIFSLEESPDLDSSSVEALCNFYAWIGTRGKRLLLCRTKEPARAVLTRAGLGTPALAKMGLSVDRAVQIALANEPAGTLPADNQH